MSEGEGTILRHGGGGLLYYSGRWFCLWGKICILSESRAAMGHRSGVRERERACKVSNMNLRWALATMPLPSFPEENMHQKFVFGRRRGVREEISQPVHTQEIIAVLALDRGIVPNQFVQPAVSARK